jgi:hypothetical protein
MRFIIIFMPIAVAIILVLSHLTVTYSGSYYRQMKTKDAIEYFGGQTALAKALGIKQASVWRWSAMQTIPHLRQLQLELLTGGKLKADPRLKTLHTQSQRIAS